MPAASLAVLAACTAAGQPPSRTPGSVPPSSPPAAIAALQYQTILKLKDDRSDPRSAEVRQQLQQISGAAIEYVRPMSGGAHVVRVVPAAPVTYEHALQRLRDSSLVEFVEHDAVARGSRP